MKKNLIFFAAIAAAALASCTKETAPVEQPQAACSTLKAVIDQDTKATVSGLKFAFEKGDAITVFNGEGHSVVYYSCTGINESIAYFEVAAGSPNQPSATVTDIIATFPQRSASTGKYLDENNIQIMLPVNHTGATEASAGYDPTAIPFVAYSSDASGVLHFKQTCGIVELTLKGKDTDLISSVTLTSSSTVIGGACTVGYKSSAPVATMTGASKTANYTFKNVALSSTGTKFYFGLPAGTHTIEFKFSDSEGQTMTKTATGLTVARGEMIPTTLTYSPSTSATYLSPDGKYANCYVIQEAGSYYFDAKKPDGTDLSASCASADWVWATSSEWNPTNWSGVSITGTDYYGKLISSVSYKDGKVYVNAPMSTTGNAIVGVLDKDGALLWSWHLWLTKELTDITSGDYTWMDRNLGAGYATKATDGANIFNASRGLYYQAGRKDPVLGAHGNGNASDAGSAPIKNGGNAIYQYNTKISGLVEWQVGSTKLSTDLIALQNPTLLVAQANLPNYEKGTVWTTNSNPCPAGYQVATVAAFTALGSTLTASQNESGNQKQVAKDGVVFSVNGYRNQSDFKRKNCNTDTRIWMYDGITDSTNANYVLISTAGALSQKTGGRANGNTVRCIKAK